jgi:hypothetical protein
LIENNNQFQSHFFFFLVDEDIDRKQILRMKVKQGVSAAESLKKRIRETTTHTGLTPPPAATATSLLPSPTIMHPADRKFYLGIRI